MKEQTDPASSFSDVTNWFGRLPVKEIVRLVALLVAMWGSLLTLGGGFIQSRADDILVEALKRKGMGPADIKLMQDRLIAMGLDVDRLGVTAKGVESQLNGLDTRLQILDANQRQTYELMRSLIPLMKAELEDRRP